MSELPNINVTVINQPEEEPTPEQSFRWRCLIQIGASILAAGVAVLSVVATGDPFTAKDIGVAVFSVVIGIWIPQPKFK
jgi:hypothetical protein